LHTGLILSAVVTLTSIEIYKTHEWLSASPTVYFTCKGENKTILPDVKKTHVLYSFKGEESWQVPFKSFDLDFGFRSTTCLLYVIYRAEVNGVNWDPCLFVEEQLLFGYTRLHLYFS